MNLTMTIRVALCLGALGALGALAGGCVSYGGISKAKDGKVYLTGSTSFLVFSSSWVKRCVEKGSELTCEELAVKPKEVTPPKAKDDGEEEEEEEAPRKRKRQE